MPTSDRNYLFAYYYRNIYDRPVHNSRFDVPFRDFLAQLFEFFKKPACFLAPPLGVGNSGRSPKGRRRNRSFKVRFTQDLSRRRRVLTCLVRKKITLMRQPSSDRTSAIVLYFKIFFRVP